MSYPSNCNEWEQSNRFDGPLEAPPFDDFKTYFETQIGPSPRKRPIPSGYPNLWRSADASSSFNESPPFPSSVWTPNASSLDLYSIPGSSSQNTLPPPFTPLTHDDYAFLANIDPALLAADLANVTANHPIPIVSEPLRHSSLSRKRPRANEEFEGPNNASIDAFSNLKRRRLSTDSHQRLHSVPPSTNAYKNNNNVITSTFNDFSLRPLPGSTSRANTTLSPTLYPNPQVFHGAPASSVPIPPAPPVLLPPVHVGATQPSATASYRTEVDNTPWWNPNADLYTPLPNLSPAPAPPVTIPPVYVSDAYPGNEGAVDYTFGLNGNGNGDLYNAAGVGSQVDALPLSYFTLPDAEDEPLDWTTGLIGQEYFYYNTTGTAVASVASPPVVVPPFLERQTPIYHTNAVANNATQSSFVDFRQHSVPTIEISTTGNVANANIPNARVPSTSGAPSIDRLIITYDVIEPSTPPSSPSPTRKRPQKSPTLYPDEKLWFFDEAEEKKKYACRYNGPDCPNGCKQKSDTSRNLGRHMRKHAKSEAGMRELSANERVALNGLPEGLLRVKAKCRLPRADLHKCAFYRQHGRRWAVMTMERHDNLERKHRDRYHDVDQ